MNDDGDLAAHIEHKERRTMDDVTDLQDYEAVSYTWGAPVMNKLLCCDNALLPITENVDFMLRRLRGNRERRLWIDAICLNQSDNDEKRHQVPLMGEIYRESSNVLIWLGDATPTELRAVDTIRKLLLIGLDKASSDLDAMQALYDMLVRPWFTRRWVLQESKAHINTRILFGSRSFSWTELMRVADAFDTEASTRLESPATSKATLCTLRALHHFPDQMANFFDRERRIYHHEHTLMNLILIFSDAECSDNRDRINALTGLAGESEWVPNYSAPWTAEYERLTRMTLLKWNGDLVIEQHLESFGSLRDICPESPPWVPNWSRPQNPTVARNWLDTISMPDASGLKPRLETTVYLDAHLNQTWNPRVTSECIPWEELHSFERESVRELEWHPCEDQISSLINLLEITKKPDCRTEEDGSHEHLLLSLLFSVLLPMDVLWQAYRKDVLFSCPLNYPYIIWWGLLTHLSRCRTLHVFKKRLNFDVPLTIVSLQDTFFLNDVLLPCLLNVLESHTIFWSCSPFRHDPNRSLSLRVGIASGVALSPDRAVYRRFEYTLDLSRKLWQRMDL